MKKTILSIALIAAMCLTIASCGKNNNNSGGNNGNSSTSTVEEEKDFAPGTHDDKLYTNESLGIAMPLDGYTPYTDEQVAQVAEQSGGGSNMTYDFVAVSEDGSTNVNILAEKLTSAAKASDAETILSSQVSSVEKQLSQYSAEVSMSEVKFCGNTEPAMVVKAEAFSEVMVCLKQGDYAVYITATGTDQASAQALLDTFYTL